MTEKAISFMAGAGVTSACLLVLVSLEQKSLART